MSSVYHGIETAGTYRQDPKRMTGSSGELLEVQHTVTKTAQQLKELWTTRMMSADTLDRSGVWRYRELIAPFAKRHIVTRFEGNTRLYDSPKLSEALGVQLSCKHEGENPTASFKDRGMTAAVSAAKAAGASCIVCASTGNTSSSAGSYAASCGMAAVVLIPHGRISPAKLTQTIASGSWVIMVKGSFDDAMHAVQDMSHNVEKSGVYPVNSLNPWRIEGQKSILIETLMQRRWKVPDRVVIPGGNLGNAAAAMKACIELKKLGFIKKLPCITVAQAEGSAPFVHAFKRGLPEKITAVNAATCASAIRIGNPVSYPRVRAYAKHIAVDAVAVTDKELMDAKASIDTSGIGAEPGSATTVAAVKKLRKQKKIKKGEDVVCLLTGHILKDTATTKLFWKDRLHEKCITSSASLSALQNTIGHIREKSQKKKRQ